MTKWRQQIRGEQQLQRQDDHGIYKPSSDCYDLPCCMSFIRRWTFFKFVPFCPTFLVNARRSERSTDNVEATDVDRDTPTGVESHI